MNLTAASQVIIGNAVNATCVGGLIGYINVSITLNISNSNF